MALVVWLTLRRFDIDHMNRLRVIGVLLGVSGVGAIVIAICAAALRMTRQTARWPGLAFRSSSCH